MKELRGGASLLSTDSKGFGVRCHPELVSGSHAEIPKRVRNDKMLYLLEQSEPMRGIFLSY